MQIESKNGMIIIDYNAISGGTMDNKKLVIAIRYYMLLQMAAGIIINKTAVTSWVVIYMFIFTINNQLMVFSSEKKSVKLLLFTIEMMLIIVGIKYIGGYLFAYLTLAAIDSNTLLDNPIKIISDAAIVAAAIYFSFNNNIEFIFINIGMIISITGALYLVKDENDRKIKAQDLYDRLRLSEDKLKKANKELEIYAGSIEEITLLRERNRISREIHDSVGHALSTIAIQLGAIEKTVAKDDEMAKNLASDLRTFTQNSLNEVRMAVREIKPKDFEEYEGIIVIEELIKNFKKLSGIDVRLAFTKEKWPLSQDQTFVIYRIVQEFLVNSVRHGKATSVQIMMAFSDLRLSVTLKDNGIGSKDIIEGIGIKSMRERTGEIGGTFMYRTNIGEGFLVKVELDKKEKPKIYSQGEE